MLVVFSLCLLKVCVLLIGFFTYILYFSLIESANNTLKVEN